uniref:Nucleolar GTP-binding protein 1 n=1 Tax=Chenopodium quinoa TaxID=63459 RepID=A0A803M4I8_CHEQI
MIGASNMLELWRIPSNKLLFGTSKFIKGSRQLPQRAFYPIMCLCKEIQTTTAEKIMGASYIPETKFKKEIKVKVNETMKIEGIGAFQKLPMVMPSIDIIQSAIRKSKKVSATKGIANIAKRERNRGAKQLDALMKSLTKKEAEERLNEGIKRVEETYYRERKAVDDLLDIAKTLRAMPVVDLETPTLSLVGAPNVGKSSLVRILSTGKPEICNYPFTTRGILMGHIVVNYQRFQVTDTPGVLKRLDEERNNLEKLTLAVLTHLPTAVLYVHDLTGECGTSASDQFTTYMEIKERFSNHLWIDVVSKCDILPESPSSFITEDLAADNSDLARYRLFGPEGAIRVSVKSGLGLDELKQKVHNMLISQSARIKSEIIDPERAATTS